MDAIAERSGIDPWFLHQMRELVEAEDEWTDRRTDGPADRNGEGQASLLRRMKRLGFSDRQLADLRGTSESEIRALRHRLGIRPAYKMVDTCAGEFPSSTPYLYSSYDEENEARGVGDRTVVILGSGPNRIGQGVEFDYCCVRAAMAFREMGFRTVMVNSNPETVSTDFDISDALYFEPLTLEDVLEIVHVEQPIGVVVQLGGQTPLRLARALETEGVRILGTSPEAIDLAEDRGRFEALTRELGVAQPPSGIAYSVDEARRRGGSDRLPGAGPALLRAGRPGDGDRVRRRLAPELLRPRRASRSRAPGADRQLPRGRLRGRRGRDRGRHPVRHRRRDAAHRGRRDPLGRLRLCPAAVPHHRGRRSRRCGGTPGRSPSGSASSG